MLTLQQENFHAARSHFHPESLSLINQLGGKVASVLFQLDKSNAKYLPPFSIDTIPDQLEFCEMRNKQSKKAELIFRPSAPGDEIGLIDMLNTGISNSAEGNMMSEIIQAGSAVDIYEYAKEVDGIEGYKGITSILVMPNLKGARLGSIISHPNIEGHYIINFDKGRVQYLVNHNGTVIKGLDRNNKSQLRQHTSDIVKMKIDTDNAGFIDEGASSQTEFAVCDTLINLDKYFSKEFTYKNRIERILSPSKIFFLQQRYFRQNDFKNSIYPKSYNFNTFGPLDDSGIKEVQDFNAPTDYLDIPTDDFILEMTGDHQTFNADKSMKLFKFVDSTFCKGIKFYTLHNYSGKGSLEHGCYKYFAGGRNMPIISEDIM